jgi:hypothetical protein
MKYKQLIPGSPKIQWKAQLKHTKFRNLVLIVRDLLNNF